MPNFIVFCKIDFMYLCFRAVLHFEMRGLKYEAEVAIPTISLEQTWDAR